MEPNKLEIDGNCLATEELFAGLGGFRLGLEAIGGAADAGTGFGTWFFGRGAACLLHRLE